MRTPDGKECKYFFGDYYRGRHHEECRLIGNEYGANQWKPDLCQNCPVPGILIANACPHMTLTAKVNKGILGIGRKVTVSAYCSQAQQAVKEPKIGCGQCHPLPPEFLENKQ